LPVKARKCGFADKIRAGARSATLDGGDEAMTEQRIVLITGGASDIAIATARHFARQSAHVVLCDVNFAELGRKAAGFDIHDVDLADPAAIARWVTMAAERHGRIDVLVNNAAVMAAGDVEAATERDFDLSYAVNLKAPFLLAKAVVPIMRRGGGGAIVNVSSVHGIAPGPRRAAYATMKAALLGLTRSMAVDLGASNIRVNAVCPTATHTAQLEQSWRERGSGVGHGNLYDWANAQHPAGRIATVDQVAEAILFLAGAAFVTGVELRVDGGLLAALRLLPPEALKTLSW
jgi:NAD(P)-dependent dehydrogenase (short-subunit alcohol dehydrogenase family)